MPAITPVVTGITLKNVVQQGTNLIVTITDTSAVDHVLTIHLVQNGVANPLGLLYWLLLSGKANTVIG